MNPVPNRPERKRAKALWLLLALASLLVLAACGTAGDDDGDADPTAGDLAVTIAGLPDDVDADVTVTGDDFEETVTASETLRNLEPGEYDVSADEVETDEGDVYSATVVGSPVTVAAGERADVTVTYEEAGSLEIDVTGLPEGQAADVLVTGPDDYEANVTGDETLTGLASGAYEIFADGVEAADGTVYGVSETSTTVDVTAGETTSVEVAYEEVIDVASLTVTIDGLPADTDADVTVTGPDGYVMEVSATEELLALEPGTYQVTAGDVLVEDVTYTGTVDQESVTLAAGETDEVTVTYETDAVDPEEPVEGDAGDPVADFGTEGVATYELGAAGSTVHEILALADESYLVAAEATDGATDSIVLAHVGADGALVTSFGTDGIATFPVGNDISALDVASVGDGFTVAAATTDGTSLDFVTYDLDAQGATLASTTEGNVLPEISEIFVTDVDVLDDGSAVAAGHFNSNPGEAEGEDDDTDLAIFRFTEGGTLDTTFSGSSGYLVADQGGEDVAHGVEVLNDGSFAVFGVAGATGDFTAIHVSEGGGLVDDFPSTIEGARFDFDFDGDSVVYDAVQAEDGDILFGGTAGGDFALVGLTYVEDVDPEDGEETPGYVVDDEAFGTEGAVTTDLGGIEAITALAIADDDDTILAAGTTTADESEELVLVRYLEDGTLDTTFGVDGVATADFEGADASATSIAATDTNVVVGGEAGGDAALAAFER